MNVVVTTNKNLPVDEDTFRGALRGVAEVRVLMLPHRELSAEEEDPLITYLGDVHGLLLRPGKISKRVINALDNLKIITTHGVGVDFNLDEAAVEAATQKGIYVTNVPGGNANAVAELTFGSLLNLIRRINQGDRGVREGKWAKAMFLGAELSGKTLGIIGLGRIGERVARIARGFDMEVLSHDPYVSEERARGAGTRLVSLKELLRESDVVTIHVSLSGETEKMIGEEELRLMKRTAVLVNTARGPIVDEASLYEALREGVIAGAALDVLEEEPPSHGNPLLQLENVVVTPHIGGNTWESLRNIAKIAAEDITRALRGETPKNLLNPEVRRRKRRD
ncbi:MAG: hydroxyacid dehydrogenase [Candidatus Geothermarchaeales archaeon]